MIDETALHSDSFMKSLRAYTTLLNPLLLERLTTLTRSAEDDFSEVTETTSYQFQATSEGFAGNALMNYIFQPLFDHETPKFQKVIYLKCSTRTRVMGDNDKLVAMKTHIQRAIRLNTTDEEPCPTFFKLCEHFLGEDVPQALLNRPFEETVLYSSIIQFFRQHGNSFPYDHRVSIPGRTVARDILMKSKYYPNRNDLRAFCMDLNPIRHLTGCCLHRLLLPKDMEVRCKLARNKVVPAQDKDKLDLVVPRLPGATHRLILVDISNFTGSAANSWAMIFIMILELDKGGNWNKPNNVFGVGQHTFQAKWKELLIVYLYLTVGYPCFIDDETAPHYLPGGFLGVAGNITIGLVYLAVVLENFERSWRGVLHFVRTQAGGDDTGIYLCGESDMVEEATVALRFALENYVGHLKNFEVIDLNTMPWGVMNDATFCKKRVCLYGDDRHYRLVTEVTVPIPSCLIPAGRLTDSEQIQEAWKNLVHETKDYRNKTGNAEIADSIRMFFLGVYPEIFPPMLTKIRRIAHDKANWEKIDGQYITQRAYTHLSVYNSFVVDNVSYLDDFRAKLDHGLASGSLRLFRLTYCSLPTTVVGMAHEKNICNEEHDEEEIDTMETPLYVELISRYHQ